MNKDKSATLKDIAQMAGLSVTAVSHALNGKRGVSAETGARVRKLAEELNYRPNIIAKSLRTNRTKTIGVIASDSSHSFYATVLRGVDATATEQGFSILLCNTDSSREREWEAVRLLVNKRVDGIILIASTLTLREDAEILRKTGVPVVFLVRRNMSDEVSFVSNDNVQGAFLIIDYLLRISAGQEPIHFLNLPLNNPTTAQRFAGYCAAHEKHGVAVQERLVRHVKPQIQEGYIAMRQLLDEEPVKTVFCGCDILAIGAMEAILERGLKIPDDIKVAGYDDIEYAPYLRVPLTTVRQPKFSLGSKGCECLLEMIAHTELPPAHITLRPELIIRESS